MKKEISLESIQKQVNKCKKCILYKTRTKPVFGDGSLDSKILFIGEAPGNNEDLQGIPFVGRAGKLLNELLESIGINRKDVYIANILKCRPPKNRNPKKDEIEKCTGYLVNQIKTIDPHLICPLGNFATQFILKLYNLKHDKISKIHGQIFETNSNQIIIPLFHPAVSIYNPNKKKDLFKDFKKIKELIK